MQQNSDAIHAGQTQYWSEDQQTQSAPAYSTQQNQYAAPAVQTQQWSGEYQMQNYAQTNVFTSNPNVASSYAVQSQQTAVYDQHPAPQPVQPQMITITDVNTTTDATHASMFATPHAEDKKAMFPSSGENTETNNTADVFSSPPPADNNMNETNNTADVFSSPAPPSDSNASGLMQQPAFCNDASPSDQPVLAPPQNENPVEDASSFFGGSSENIATTKTFGGLPPPPVFKGNTARPLSAPSSTGGTSSLPPPPMMKSFSNQTPNTAVVTEDEIPTEQFADVSF
jgi:hypothetical protein